MRTQKRSFAKEVQAELRRILSSRPDDDLTLAELATLVVGGTAGDAELWAAIQEQAVQRFVGACLNRAKITLADGRKVRRFQAYTKHMQSDDGREVQQHIWKEIDSMTRAQMLTAAKERKGHIDDSRKALQADLDYWNENVRGRFGAKAIALEF